MPQVFFGHRLTYIFLKNNLLAACHSNDYPRWSTYKETILMWLSFGGFLQPMAGWCHCSGALWWDSTSWWGT